MTRAALVTGGAKRLGAAFARALAEGGWRVVVHYGTSRDEAEALTSEIGGASVQADLSDLEAAPGLIARAADAIGAPLTGLVNSASVFEHDTASDVKPGSLTRHFAVNAAAPALLTRAFAAQAPDGHDACAVQILDQKLWSPNPDHFAYTLSKAALREAVRTSAQALAPVRVVGVAPGYCLPNPTESEESFEARAAKHNLLRRRLEPAHVAQAVAFAMGCPAVTGSTILADNGEHLVATDRDVVFT